MKIVNSIFERLSFLLSHSKEKNNLQQSIIDLLPNCHIFWKDTNSIYLGCNVAFAAAAEVNSPTDIVGKTDYDFPWTKEESDAYRADDRQIMQTRQARLNIIEPQTLPDDRKAIISTSKVPLINDKNEVYGVLGIYFDITEQKANEENLKKTQQKQEKIHEANSLLQTTIIDNLPNYFIFWKNKNSVFLGCNKAFATSAKLASPADVVGKTDYDLPWSKEESDRYIADDKQVMMSRQTKLNIEEPQTLPDGRKIILSTSKVPLFDEKGEVNGILAIYSDITQQKTNEQRLLEANQKLERSNKVKSEFIRNVSHDIRTPLSGIQQITQAISDNKIPEAEIPEYAFSAWEASKKLMDLFNQVIDISKKEYFDFEDQVVKFDLYHLLNSFQETYGAFAKNKSVQLEIEYSDKVPHYLVGKHHRLHRVLLNLLGNALKFTEKGNVKLLTEVARESNGKVIMRFSVIDTGIGIAPEKHHIIFEPFTRLNSSFDSQYKGFGLGLHSVKEYMEKMQGEIYVESEEGKGSMFTCVIPFKLPILDNDNDVLDVEYKENMPFDEIKLKNPPIQSSSTTTTTTTNNAKTTGHVLLVEDDMMAQKMGLVYLKDKSYQVDLAKSGKEALELTAKNSYDIIYMDIGLSAGIDGIETTRRIRKDAQNKSQKAFITAITAHGTNDESIVMQCRAAGMQHILSKPLSPEKIAEIQTIATKKDSSAQNNTVIDFDLWRSRLGEAVFMLEELVHMLGQDFDRNRKDIKQAYEAHDFPTLKAVTHKLKGSLLYSGLPRLEKVVVAIELAAKQSNIEEVDRWYPETMSALDEAESAYQEWAKSH